MNPPGIHITRSLDNDGVNGTHGVAIPSQKKEKGKRAPYFQAVDLFNNPIRLPFNPEFITLIIWRAVLILCPSWTSMHLLCPTILEVWMQA
jgi:hypothetical protein